MNNIELNYLPPQTKEKYFIPEKTKGMLEQAVLMHLFYDLIIALKQEDFFYCSLLRDELNKRKEQNKIDHAFLEAFIEYFSEYSKRNKMNDDSIKIIKSYLI